MSVDETGKRLEGEIIPPYLAVRAMRDSGYRNTAYALAELIDNSIQAGAKNVEVVCVQAREMVNERSLRRMAEIAVIDDGEGMTREILRSALQFGNGTHLQDRQGIGRFGMGLPNSSISQCRRVDVWTWQSGPDNAVHSYLDVDGIEGQLLYLVPDAEAKPLPQEWSNRSGIINTTGTLVLWTKFDENRLTWRGAKTTLEHTETLAGRMYRKFIDDGRVAIRLLGLEEEKPICDWSARVNDPLYLMRNSSTPEPFDKEPMFQTWGEGDEVFDIDCNGESHKVVVRMSWARQETVPEDKSDRGSKPYGKHAANNLGVSIVRAGRELDLDRGWASTYDPRDRWWGVEIEFSPKLDEMFGVTNNKQSTTIFSAMSQFDWKSEAEPGETESNFLARIQAEGDPRASLFSIVKHIQLQIQEVRQRVIKQTAGRRTKDERHDKPTSEDQATSKFNQRAEQGHETAQDREEFDENSRDALETDLVVDKDYSKRDAKDISTWALRRNRRVVFVTKAMEGYAFFNIEYKQGGLTEVVFNTNHPFHEHLVRTLSLDLEDDSDSDLLDRMAKAADTVELLFAAWARYEMEEIGQREQLHDLRQEWGKMARFFLSESGG